jgi:threonine aldolase
MRGENVGEYSSGFVNTGRLSGRQDAALHGRRNACRYIQNETRFMCSWDTTVADVDNLIAD